MKNNLNNRKRTILRLALAGVAVLGIGAAITTAVWTDNVFFTATATSSSFDLQGRSGTAGAWLDVGIPGDSDTVPITITGAGLDTISPSETVTVPFQLCNVGTSTGSITAVTAPTFAGDFATAAGITVTMTGVTVGTPLPADTVACTSPITGNVVVTTTAAFVAQGVTDTITFDVTGTSD